MAISREKKIQTKVIIGKGTKKFYEELCFDFTTTPLYLIEDVKTKVEVYHVEIAHCNTVIVNYRLRKNIMYKTAPTPPITCSESCDCNTEITINGDMKHSTKTGTYGGFVDITLEDGEEIKHGDKVEILEAKVIGDADVLLDPTPIEGTDQNVYGRLLEKVVVLIKVKVVRDEHLTIPINDEEHDSCC